jgi:methyl-accepting chemotaxis protein
VRSARGGDSLSNLQAGAGTPAQVVGPGSNRDDAVKAKKAAAAVLANMDLRHLSAAERETFDQLKRQFTEVDAAEEQMAGFLREDNKAGADKAVAILNKTYIEGVQQISALTTKLIQHTTGNATGAIGEISQVVGQISEIQSTIAAAVEEQAATTAEIGRSVAEVAGGTRQIAENISGVASDAGSTSEGANDTQQAARGLATMAGELTELVSTFRI